MEYSEGKYVITQLPNKHIMIVKDLGGGYCEIVYHASYTKKLKKAELKEYLHDILISFFGRYKPNGNIVNGYTCPNCGERLTIKQSICKCGCKIDWE